MLGTVAKIIGGILVGIIMLVSTLAFIKGSANTETTQRNLLAKAYLDKNKNGYIKCHNSLTTGDMLIGNVKWSYLSYDTPDAKKARLNETEAAFKAQVNSQCEKPIADYEANLKTLKETDAEIANASRSVLDIALGFRAEDKDYSNYEVARLRLASDPFTDLVFTENDVKQFYLKEMGY